MSEGNRYVSGNEVTVWVNGVDYKAKSFEYKISYEFEDVPDGLKTYKKLVKISCEGTMGFSKTQSLGLKLTGDVLKTGKTPDITITSKALNAQTGKAERLVFRNVVITEAGMSSENQSLVEEEIPFACDPPEVLELM
ncbi:hypothetical protein G5B47_02545 [Paenibacillus sp. 7124]|uniref:Phage tail tube protein n=1 Tax=Paenibacillus apii TaxID=1850370 RepID=A0A6M1PDH5_9BACL|nr:phage tail tube protein [Paenibacillus apii]NGM81287.1 hypothetical protein [Paenibacillus apii]